MNSALGRLLDAALEWQEAVDALVATAPLPQTDPTAQILIKRATDTHMALLHATRECRAMLAEIAGAQSWPPD